MEFYRGSSCRCFDLDRKPDALCRKNFLFFFLEVEVVDGSHTRSPCAQDNSFFFHPYNTAFENNVC